jgi:hypothetical protein
VGYALSQSQRIVNLLKTEGILREIEPASGSRAATLAFSQLLNVAEGYDAF